MTLNGIRLQRSVFVENKVCDRGLLLLDGLWGDDDCVTLADCLRVGTFDDFIWALRLLPSEYDDVLRELFLFVVNTYAEQESAFVLQNLRISPGMNFRAGLFHAVQFRFDRLSEVTIITRLVSLLGDM